MTEIEILKERLAKAEYVIVQLAKELAKRDSKDAEYWIGYASGMTISSESKNGSGYKVKRCPNKNAVIAIKQ